MTVKTASGSTIAIGTTAAATTLSDFQGDTYTQLGEVENMGDFGDSSPEVPFASIGDGRTRKSKGARDAGTMAVIVGHDPLDAGQDAIEVAEQTNFEYNFRVILADAKNANFSNSTFYFKGLVMSQRKNVGTNDNIVRKTYNIAINSAIVEDASVSSP